MTGPLPDRVLWRVLRVCGLAPSGLRELNDRRSAREWDEPGRPERLGHRREPRREAAP